jgi:hypothetical protein
MDTRSAILAYSLSEKLKTGLLWTAQLVEIHNGQSEEQRAGSTAVIRAIVSMTANEAQLARKLVAADHWEGVEKHLNLALVMIDSGVVQEATFHLTQALSHATTIGQRSMGSLIDQGLL